MDFNQITIHMTDGGVNARRVINIQDVLECFALLFVECLDTRWFDRESK